MTRLGILTLALFSFAIITVANAADLGRETIDPEIAKTDPDFLVQGEYVGKGAVPFGEGKQVGAQVIARGSGNFDVVLYQDGLPGDGWTREKDRVKTKAKTEGGTTTLSGEGLTGTIADGKMTLKGDGGEAVLQRVVRKSETLGMKPPAGAIVLFGEDLSVDMLEGDMKSHVTDMDTLLAGFTTKPVLDGEYTLHLEFCLSYMPTATGQARSNSGVYLHDCYECQVLDSFGLEGHNNECGGFYQLQEPKVNMCLPPLQWQTYDIEMKAPKYVDGEKVENARVTVRHNGVVIHNDLEMPSGTPGRQGEGPGPRALHCQGHGNQVNYRNIWAKMK